VESGPGLSVRYWERDRASFSSFPQETARSGSACCKAKRIFLRSNSPCESLGCTRLSILPAVSTLFTPYLTQSIQLINLPSLNLLLLPPLNPHRSSNLSSSTAKRPTILFDCETLRSRTRSEIYRLRKGMVACYCQ
jgi:hypothetical protein